MINEIKYFHGTGYVKGTGMPEDLTVAVNVGKNLISSRITESFRQEHIADLDGVHGDPDVGDPVEVDILRLKTAEKSVATTVFNRGIILLTADSEAIRRFHRFISVLEKELGWGLCHPQSNCAIR